MVTVCNATKQCAIIHEVHGKIASDIFKQQVFRRLLSCAQSMAPSVRDEYHPTPNKRDSVRTIGTDFKEDENCCHAVAGACTRPASASAPRPPCPRRGPSMPQPLTRPDSYRLALLPRPVFLRLPVSDARFAWGSGARTTWAGHWRACMSRSLRRSRCTAAPQRSCSCMASAATQTERCAGRCPTRTQRSRAGSAPAAPSDSSGGCAGPAPPKSRRSALRTS
mmetsp:Transcript_56514/g.93832  ORF Transcript_56514/g.93832 Transcript_56514/m.93832 type:complete len:222 (-) Transcript_56514:28-693(-)